MLTLLCDLLVLLEHRVLERRLCFHLISLLDTFDLEGKDGRPLFLCEFDHKVFSVLPKEELADVLCLSNRIF